MKAALEAKDARDILNGEDERHIADGEDETAVIDLDRSEQWVWGHKGISWEIDGRATSDAHDT